MMPGQQRAEGFVEHFGNLFETEASVMSQFDHFAVGIVECAQGLAQGLNFGSIVEAVCAGVVWVK